MPDHPLLQDLDEKTPAEIASLRERLFDPKKQPNAQIAEQVEVEITIDPEAAAGDRELRLLTANGLTNPVRFQVGGLPEVREEELGGVVVDLPAVLNGQVMPGATDRFRLRARQGQQLVIRVQARQLTPYLADAVPGWFQATVALYDPQGNPAAYDDDYRFDPDPALEYTVPADGVYGLEIRDSIFRGREDFVYRIAVGELPFITRLFPLGAQAGAPTVAALGGWNLPVKTVELDTRPDGSGLRQVRIGQGAGLSNEVRYAVEALPESAETEPNDTAETAQKVALPLVVNGRVGRPGDVDVYQFEGRAGQEVVAEVEARRLGSPLDSVLRLVDAAGAVVAANDDRPDPESGLLTHQADSYLRVKLPADGMYRVFLSDAQRQGGDEYGYRLQLRPAQPDFALRVTPSSLSMLGRRAVTGTVTAIRKDGFDGDIDIMAVNPPAGFVLGAARIPSGKDTVQVTLSAPRDAVAQVFVLRLEGRAQIGGAAVAHPAVPAEDMMQAFAYRHLVPQQELLVAVTGSRQVPAVWRPLAAGMTVAQAGTVRIPLGGTAEVAVTAPQVLPDQRRTPLGEVRFSLCKPPRGVRLQGARVGPNGVALTFKADANSTQVGYAGNLLVEAYVELAAPGGDQPAPRKQRVSLGVLPALSFQIVR